MPTEAKSIVPDWGIKSTMAQGFKVDSGIELPMLNVMEQT
jgi:hypothetical protein